MSMYQLPDELILKVLSYLEIKDFLSCGQGGVHVLWVTLVTQAKLQL